MDDVTKNNMDDLPFGFRPLPVNDELRERNWKAVEDAIRAREAIQMGDGNGRRRVIRLIRVFAAAACVAALGFGLWWIGAHTGSPQYAQQKTGYGEMKTIVLPDSSVVILNSNSSLRIPEQWADESGRQVWLEGEAYFQVNKQPATAAKFVVHTRQVDVEVLGTKFNINTRRQRAVVALEEGKVRLSMHGNDSAILVKKAPVIMRPGQVVVVNSAQEASINEEKLVATHSSWTRHEFHFDHTRLDEVARLVEDTYGYRMQMEDSVAMGAFMVSGDIRVRNVEEMAKVLEASSGYAMRIEERTIFVRYH